MVTEIIYGAKDLVMDPQTQKFAIALAVAAFILGGIAMCILCKLCCPCGKKRCERKLQAKREHGGKGEEKFEKRHPAPADGSVEIYVGNLSYDLTEDQLRKEFEAFGKVNSARIITNRYTNRSKGFGFVHMPDLAAATAAVKALNDKELLGRKLKCNQAKNVY